MGCDIIKIYKTIIIPVKCSAYNLNYLFECNKLSALVWNQCVYLDNKYKENNEGKFISQNELQKELKNHCKLHAKGIQHIIIKYVTARSAMFKSIKAKHENSNKVKLPYKKKKYFVTGWDKQSIKIYYDKGIIKLSKPKMYLDNKNKIQKPIKCYSKNIPQNIVEIELIWKGKLYLAIKYIEEKEYKQINSNNSASIDLGEIHAITSIDSDNGNVIIITGRKIRTLRRLKNKHQAKIYNKMSKCTKDSKKYKKYLKALNKLKKNIDNKILNCVHKITKLYLDYCLFNSISTVYYGDLDSATRSTKQKKKMNKLVRQKLNQWNFGQIVKQLENKLTRYGIELVKVKEYYTSSKCPNCTKLNKPTKRNYICSCGYKQHRDIVGAINILNDNANTNLTKYKTFKYLQIS